MPRVASLHYHTIGNKIWKKTPSSKIMTTKSFSTKTDDLEKSLQLNFSRKNKIRVWKKSLFFEFEAESSKLLLAMDSDSGKERVSLNAASEERSMVGDEPPRPRRGWVLGSGKIPETNRIETTTVLNWINEDQDIQSTAVVTLKLSKPFALVLAEPTTCLRALVEVLIR